MKRNHVIALAVAGILLVVGFFLFKPQSFSKKIEEVSENLTSYTLIGEMELNKGEDLKSYLLEVNYRKGVEDDCFKVSLYDKNLNQEQILLRSDEGVFVITPSLNQIFKFEGEWPLNSPKPYLLQTMFDVMNQEDSLLEKIDQGLKITAPVHYPNNKHYKQQEMIFTKDAKPKSVTIYDDEKTAQLKILFSDVSYNTEIKDDVFKVPEELSNSVSSQIEAADLPLYPVSVFDSKLVDSKSYQVNSETRHILEYSGDKHFTLVQSVKPIEEDVVNVFKSGEMIDTIELVGFYDGASMSAYVNNVEMTLYSQDLSVEEMVSVLSSLQVAVMK